jgi:hypothetical protein
MQEPIIQKQWTRQGADGRHRANVDGYLQEVPAYWGHLNCGEVHAVANGCGLAGWPGWLRWLLDAISVFRAPSVVHDVEWWRAIKPEDIEESNGRFFRNCLRMSTATLAHVALPLRLPQFVWLAGCAVVFRVAVGIGGLEAKRRLRTGRE